VRRQAVAPGPVAALAPAAVRPRVAAVTAAVAAAVRAARMRKRRLMRGSFLARAAACAAVHILVTRKGLPIK